MTREAAEMLAVQALTYLAGEPERLGRFLALSGIGPEAIRSAAHEPGFLAGILEHIAGDEALLMQFARAADIDPAQVGKARAALAGPRWEIP
jgi:hypothetical protein